MKFLEQMRSANFLSWIEVQQAYFDYAFSQKIVDYGFDGDLGSVYIDLDNEIRIIRPVNFQVEYIVYTDNETLEYESFASYFDALDLLNELNNK